MIDLLIKALLAYLLGSVSGSMVVGALRHVDIRLQGSGNAGGTNAFRTQGLKFALGVVLIDIGKSMVAAGLLPLLTFPGLDSADFGLQQVVCGLAAVVGHCYPAWHGFRGGKGAAAGVGAVLVIQPLAALPLLGVWLLTLMLTGWVGLSTMLAAVALVPTVWMLGAPTEQKVFAVLIAAFLVFTHRSNIRRMREGREHRFEKARVLRRHRRGESAAE